MSFESRFSSIFSLNLLNVSDNLLRIMSVMTLAIDPMDSDFAMGLAAMALGSSGLCSLVRVHISGNATALSAIASAMSKRRCTM